VAPSAPASASAGPSQNGQIGGLSALKGLILYGAVFAFASLYVYFIVRIFEAKAGKPPTFDGTLVSAAAALAGVLGSAFALQVGTSTDQGGTNTALGVALAAPERNIGKQVWAWLRLALSLEPRDTKSASWPKTFGIWAYAVVGTAVAITYACNQNETPGAIKALAVAFGGYVITLVTTAYGIKGKAGG
jgi:hypothetical protein